jgi:superfamily II DNA or RNA helicase/HKD family nuclease
MDLNDLDPFGQDVGFGYLDRTVRGPRQFNPHLVLNSDSDSMLRALRQELGKSTSFTFSVAFVSPRALALLKQELIDFEGVGRIVTSDYLGFNSPQAFAELLNLQRIGIDVRLHNDSAFHPKGYVFQTPENVTAILGSSNLTEGALAQNHEWNLKVSAQRDSDLAEQFSNLLDEQLFNSSPLTQGWIDDYAASYVPPIRGARVLKRGDESGEIEPNSMQTDALASIQRLRDSGKDKALIVSATGTGKTILSALDVRAADPRRVLFVAHREQILDRAIEEFQRVLRKPPSQFGKLVGSKRELNRQYVFATVQTLSQESVLAQIDATYFDYILIDEVHRAGAASFGRVIEHFTPDFLLGMTATPERGDGANIFELFDFNVPYEIRLNTALELQMLSPFHYYGVADFTFDDGEITDDTTTVSRLVARERVDHIVSALETYGQAGVPPRGLIFCSRKDEARALSLELNGRSFRGVPLRTVALTGDDSIEHRELVVEQLEAGELDYVLTVDIFNEGVDIPSVNQVVMLRQTQSSIVFVQQLGRGLRHAPGKEYLVVIDFIGNYTNNFLIPIALFGDESLNKESLRKNLISAEEIGVISGLSSVRFDRIAQERVLSSIASARLDSFPNLKAAIEGIRNRVGRVPLLSDFLRFESVDPVVLATKVGNYAELLKKLKIEDIELSDNESRYLTVVSKELLTSKRVHELLVLRQLIERRTMSLNDIANVFRTSGIVASKHAISGVIRSVTLEFNTASELKSFGILGPAEQTDDGIRLVAAFAESYDASGGFRKHIDDLIETGLALIPARYKAGSPFTPGRQYSRKDACRLLNWRSNMYSTVYGYKVDSETNSCPIFVTLHKSSDVSASTAYKDALIDTSTMHWDSKNGRTLESRELRPILENSVALHVFAKKNDAEDFYYLGQAQSSDAEQASLNTDGGDVPVVRMKLSFSEPIETALFDYFEPVVTG